MKAQEQTWVKLIGQLEKYFHVKPNQVHEDDYIVGEITNYHVIISPKKQWAFDMFNKLVFNKDQHLNWSDDFHGWYRFGLRSTNYYDNGEGTLYRISTKPYLNGNQLFVIEIEKK